MSHGQRRGSPARRMRRPDIGRQRTAVEAVEDRTDGPTPTRHRRPCRRRLTVSILCTSPTIGRRPLRPIREYRRRPCVGSVHASLDSHLGGAQSEQVRELVGHAVVCRANVIGDPTGRQAGAAFHPRTRLDCARVGVGDQSSGAAGSEYRNTNQRTEDQPDENRLYQREQDERSADDEPHEKRNRGAERPFESLVSSCDIDRVRYRSISSVEEGIDRTWTNCRCRCSAFRAVQSRTSARPSATTNTPIQSPTSDVLAIRKNVCLGGRSETTSGSTPSPLSQ